MRVWYGVGRIQDRITKRTTIDERELSQPGPIIKRSKSRGPSFGIPRDLNAWLGLGLHGLPKNCRRRFVRQSAALRKLRGADWPYFRSGQFSLSLEDILPTLEA